MKRPFTGRHMLAVLVCGFGIVVAVNFTMAALASSTFGGVVVKNSYVASQKFNGWLAEAERSRALGWDVAAQRGEGGFVDLALRDVPEGAVITAAARQPLGPAADRALLFAPVQGGFYRSRQALPDGRWTLRIEVQADGDVWRGEGALP